MTNFFFVRSFEEIVVLLMQSVWDDVTRRFCLYELCNCGMFFCAGTVIEGRNNWKNIWVSGFIMLILLLEVMDCSLRLSK